ncbi:hypothetical protein ACHAXR_008374 [Thalassiosira sp. AJA248-18]
MSSPGRRILSNGEVLMGILLAHHGDWPAGHWVVMKANISGVDIFTMASAWSTTSISFIVSSSGKTIRHTKNFATRYEDEVGNSCKKELPHPAIAHQLYELLPSIDEHNKARQERWDRSNRAGKVLCTYKDGQADLDIKEMANLVAQPLKDGSLKFRDEERWSSGRMVIADGKGDSLPLTRIRGNDVDINYKARDGSAKARAWT